MNAKFTEWLIIAIFILTGVGLIVGNIFSVISSSNFKETALETTAEVVGVDKHTDSDGYTNYTVYVSYTVDETMYNGSYSTTSYVPEGSNETIYYDKNNPNEMRSSTSNSGNIILSILEIIFFVIGIGMLINKINKIKSKKRALTSGDKIYADFQEVIINSSYSINNKHPYIIICTGKDNLTGEIRTFKSENLWNNPEYIIKVKNITTFPVYIDKTNRKNYYLSLENLEME